MVQRKTDLNILIFYRIKVVGKFCLYYLKLNYGEIIIKIREFYL